MGLWDGDTPGTILHGPSLHLISRPPLCPGDPCGIGPVASYLPGRVLSPNPVAARTSAFLECVCISDICILGALEKSIFVMRQMKKNEY